MMASARLRLPLLAVGLTLFLVFFYYQIEPNRAQETWEAVAEITIPKGEEESIDIKTPQEKILPLLTTSIPTTITPEESSIPSEAAESAAETAAETAAATASETTPTPEPEVAEPIPSPTAVEEIPSPTPEVPPPRYAIVTSVWDSNYASMALMLGWSIKQHNRITDLNIEMILLTVDGDDGSAGITVENATRLERIGWRVHLEPQLEIYGLDTSKIMSHRRKNLNKLKIFGWEEYDKIVFMDADTVCKGSIEELFTMPGEFAAAPDSWPRQEIDSKFNSGVMVLTPSQRVYHDMMIKIVDPKYHDPREGDQAFLQNFWRYKSYGLPMRYNLNLVMVGNHKEGWDKIWPEANVIHFTIRKPVVPWKKPGHCKPPVDGKTKCYEYDAIGWYSKEFEKMRRAMGFENEIGLLG